MACRAAEVEALTAYGQCFGMVFQLRDDVLDVVATDEELGKPAGQDLAEGIYTLPVLLALEDPDAGPELRTLLGQPLGQPERDKARAIVAASPGVAGTVAVARRYVADAAEAAVRRPVAHRGRRAQPDWPPRSSTTCRDRPPERTLYVGSHRPGARRSLGRRLLEAPSEPCAYEAAVPDGGGPRAGGLDLLDPGRTLGLEALTRSMRCPMPRARAVSPLCVAVASRCSALGSHVLALASRAEILASAACALAQLGGVAPAVVAAPATPAAPRVSAPPTTAVAMIFCSIAGSLMSSSVLGRAPGSTHSLGGPG